MKKVLLAIILLILIPTISFGQTGYIHSSIGSGSGWSSSADCSGVTGLGLGCYNTGTGVLCVGNGSSCASVGTGDPGATGASLLSGTGAPGAVGSNGDHYLNISNGDVYKKVGGVWGTAIMNIQGSDGADGAAGAAGADGADGADGTDGATWLSGSGAPLDANGNNGDLYLDSATGDVYLKTDGAWGESITTLSGPTGAAGAGFEAGTDGTYGMLVDANTSAWSECTGSVFGLGAIGTNAYICDNGTAKLPEYQTRATPLTAGNGGTAVAPRGYYVQTGTTALVLPTAAAGQEFCIRQDTGGSAVLTVTPPTGGYLEATDASAYCTQNYKLVSGGAATDKICLVGKSSTQYQVWSYVGTWTCTAP